MKKLHYSLLLILFFGSSQAQNLCFDPTADVRYDAGEGTQAIAVGDFNEDNDLDAVAANYLAGSVSIFIGNGDGTFENQIELGNLPGSAEDVEVGEFNGDTHDDILVCLRGGSENLALLTGNGDGTFNTATYISLGLNSSQFRETELADVDDDNIPDVVYNVMQDSTVYMLKTIGDGTFTVIDSVVTSGKSFDVSLGDVNGDTYPDLAVAYQLDNAYISYYLGNGDGSFGNENTLALTFTGPYAGCVMQQLDADGHFDIVAESSTKLYAWKSDGTGGFTLERELFIGAQPNWLVAGNFDNTGNADIAWVEGASGSVGSLTDTAVYALDVLSRGSAFGDARSAALGDFNNDGDLDIVAGCYAQGYITFLEGNGDGTFGPLELRTYGFPEAIAAADFDGDQHTDIITANFFSDVWMSFMKGNGDGTFEPTVNHSIYTGAQDLQAINVDGDTDLDVVIVTNGGHLLIEHNDGTGNFSDEDIYATVGSGGDRALTVGDFNNDQEPDLAFCFGNNDDFNVFINTGLDSFADPTNFGTGVYPSDIFAADLNGDDYDDIVTANDQSNDISVHINNQSGGFMTQVDYVTGSGCRGLTIADFNNDQELDIATVNNNSVNVSILLGNGDGTFQTAVNVALGAGTSPLQIAHGLVDPDGELDLVVSYGTQNQVALLTGNGDGTFNNPQTFSTDDNPDALALADFNEDNALDISVTNYNTQNVSVILNNSAFIEASGSTQLCEGEDVMLTASGGFSYLWNTGETTPSIIVDESDTYTVDITNQAGDCTIIPAGIIVTVNTAPNVNLNNINQSDLCVSDNFVSLNGGSPQGGDYSGITVQNGVFDPSGAGAGVHTLYYSYTDPAGCFTITDSADYVIHAEVLATNDFPLQSLCVGSNPIDLSNYGQPIGGEWVIDYDPSTEFNPQTLGLGDYDVHYITSNAGCRDTATVLVEVINAVAAALQLPVDSICMDAGLLTLEGGTPAGGDFFGLGVNTGAFDPTLGGSGTITIGYGYDAGAGCADSAYASIEVIDSVHVQLTASDTIVCVSNPALSAMLTGEPSGGMFFGPGVIGDVFYGELAGEGYHLIGYAAGNGYCIDTSYVVIRGIQCLNVAEAVRHSMQVYPNPSSREFNVIFLEDDVEGDLELRNMLGQIIWKQQVNNQKNIRIEGNWPVGNYLLVLKTDDFVGSERLTVVK